ncbi:MAG: endoflagellar filament sheath protein, partial [Spirochaetae bacterium HGW-Spirochaetae-10]
MKFKVSIPTLVAAVAGVSSMFLVDGVRAGVETAIGNDVTASEMRAITVESWDRDYSNGG